MYNIQNYGKRGTKSDGENDWEKRQTEKNKKIPRR